MYKNCHTKPINLILFKTDNQMVTKKGKRPYKDGLPTY